MVVRWWHDRCGGSVLWRCNSGGIWQPLIGHDGVGVEDDGGGGDNNGVMVIVRLWRIDTTKVVVMAAAPVK